MYTNVKIAPSILSANFMNLESDIRLIEDAGAGYIHVDVMDGHFVPNLTIGVPIVKQLKKIARLPLDVHLMITNPLEELPWFINAGADCITVHAEVLDSAGMKEAISIMKDAGVKAAVALKPHTPVETIREVLRDLDMVLIMSVEPGFSGQSYIEGSEEKVAAVVRISQELGVSPLIEVDGGIGVETVARVTAAVADVLVCGNAVYGADNPAAALKKIAEIGDKARLNHLDELRKSGLSVG
ncbi:MAG: ribulose-phosphate 3-epimerase [Eggerthellaceae bacterium]|jgi:ribulose-phosphate 3-epimerase